MGHGMITNVKSGTGSARPLSTKGTNMGKVIEVSLEQQNSALKAQVVALQQKIAARSTLSVKVSPQGTGAVCVYGLARRPVTLYASQWERLGPFVPKVLEYIGSHGGEVSRREE